MTLKDIYEKKKDARALETEIKYLKEKSGIDKMEAQLMADLAEIKELMAEYYKRGEVQEGTIRIVNKGKSRRTINVERLQQKYKDEYECLVELATIPVGKTEEFFKDYPNADKILESICDSKIQDSFDIIDMMEGE